MARTLMLALVVARCAIGVLFAVAGALKVGDAAAFQRAIDGFALLPAWGSAAVAVVLPWLELAVGVVVLVGGWGWRSGLALAGGLAALFAAALGSAWLRGLDPTCGCFGHDGGHVAGALARDLSLLAAIIVVARFHPRSPTAAEGFWRGSARPAALYVASIVALAVIALRPSPIVVTPAPAPAAPIRPTAALAGYATWPTYRQRAAIAELERAATIDPETTRFLVAILRDHEQSATMRNLAANALTAPGRWVGGLAALLIGQAHDATEDPLWRDYALQHATTVAVGGVDVDQVVSALVTEARSGGASAGTALLQLQRLDRAGRVPLDPSLLAALCERIFAQPEADLGATIAVLGVLGQRRDTTRLCEIRALVASSSPSVRRSAFGALGLLGEVADVAMADSATADADPTVAAAAAIARDRLRTRLRL